MSPYHSLLPRGAVCDLVTPFRGGELDRVGLLTLIEWQIRSGICGLVVCGEAGEAPTLTMDERCSVIQTAVEVAERTVPVFVGCGTNSTETTIALTEQARALGAHAALLTVPYYSKPSQEGIFRHVEAVAAAVDIPLIICNAPSRTAVDLAPRTWNDWRPSAPSSRSSTARATSRALPRRGPNCGPACSTTVATKRRPAPSASAAVAARFRSQRMSRRA